MNFVLNATHGGSGFWNAVLAYFNPDMSAYGSFGSKNGIVNIHVVAAALFMGIMATAIYTIYTKKILGKMVRKLIAAEAFSPESAKTLEELGLEKNYAVRSALKGYTLGKVVSSLESDAHIEEINAARKAHEEKAAELKAEGKRAAAFKTPKFEVKAKDCHYYIAEKDRYKAEMRFDARGSVLGIFFLGLVLAVVCVVALYGFLPKVLALMF